MPSHTLHVVQAFEQRDGGIVPLEPICRRIGPQTGLRRCCGSAWSRGWRARIAQIEDLLPRVTEPS
jgi:hypothetical protein